MNKSESKTRLSWKYPATIKNVERVCSAAALASKKFPLRKQDWFATELLLREALNNAVVHGCRNDPSLSFSCRLTISDQKIIIEVSDEGTGFDWRRKSEFQPANSDESGRGLSIYAIYANSIKFNESGNCVTLTQIF
jgi:serine/threonine-protein kinase RsbW